MTTDEEEIDRIVKEGGEAGYVRWLTEQYTAELIDEHLGIHEDTGWEPTKLTAAKPYPPPSVCEYAPGKHLFTPGYNDLLFGAGESGKTWIAYLAAVQEVRRGNAALLVDFEMGDSLVLDRLRSLGMTDEEIDAGIVHVHPQMTATKRDRARLVDGVAEKGRVLTAGVIDSLTESASMEGLHENDTGDMTRWFRLLPRWMVRQWPEAAVVVIDHLPKDLADAELPIGSQRKKTAAHALISVRNEAKFDREHDGYSILTVRRSRGGHLPEGKPVARLDGGPSGFRLGPIQDEDAHVARRVMLRSRIFEYLADHPKSRTGDITKGVRGRDETILAELQAMVADKMVAVEEVGNARLCYLTGAVVEIHG